MHLDIIIDDESETWDDDDDDDYHHRRNFCDEFILRRVTWSIPMLSSLVAIPLRKLSGYKKISNRYS